MTELAADGIPVAVNCRVLNIARQPYYRWLARPVTDAEWSKPTGRRVRRPPRRPRGSDTDSWATKSAPPDSR
ncbi:hypothetical protein [Actinoplanes solisilvae]|uniref:hypothetical protein n=1 Tax=Actinoplanes solisilvae TaxID=2486853 RepID=UPI000FD8B4EF|nr:hypothetical protein [Actinoplanes solisilvae]